MTSLAHQLKRLALPQNDPNLFARKEVASLLFESKYAATMDRTTFYALGEQAWVSVIRRERERERWTGLLSMPWVSRPGCQSRGEREGETGGERNRGREK